MAKPEKQTKAPVKKQLFSELSDLKIRLREAEEALAAIRSGSVDAIVVSGKTGEKIYTLPSADQSYRFLVETINEGVVTMSPEGTILYSNRQFAGMLGYSLEKIIDASFLDFVCGEDRHHVEAALKNHIKQVYRFPALLNSYTWGRLPTQITMGVADVPGVATLTAIITDLSEQVRYREIVRAEKLSRSILDNSPDGIAVCDSEGVVIRASRALHRFYPGNPLLKPFDEVFAIEIPAGDGEPRRFSTSDVLAGKPQKVSNSRLYCPGGEVYDISFTAVPLRSDDQAVIGCLITITDITERKRAEAEIGRTKELSESLNSIGEVLHANLDANQILQKLVDLGAEALGSDTAAVSLRQDDGWTVSHVQGLPGDIVGTRTTDDQEQHAVLAIKSYRSVAVADVRNDVRVSRSYMDRLAWSYPVFVDS
jgi:PAS domain S-box-containing protein